MKFISSLLLFLVFTGISCRSQQSETALTATDFKDKIAATAEAVILDVRTPEEFQKGNIGQSVNIDYRNESFKTDIAKLDKSKPYFVYCLSGARSGAAAGYMRSIGFKTVYEMKGGILAWQKNNLPLTGTSAAAVTDKISAEQYASMTSSDSVVLIDFYAPWCAPCKEMEPMLAELAKSYKGKAAIIRLNIDDNKQLAKQLNVEEIPVFKLYRNGKETWMHKGIIDKDALVKVLGE